MTILNVACKDMKIFNKRQDFYTFLPNLDENRYPIWLRIITQFGCILLPNLAENHYPIWTRITGNYNLIYIK